MASAMDSDTTAPTHLQPPCGMASAAIITDHAQGYLPCGSMTLDNTVVPLGVQMPFGGMWKLPLACVPGVQQMVLGHMQTIMVRFWHLPTGPLFCLADILTIKYDNKAAILWVKQHSSYDDNQEDSQGNQPRHGASVTLTYNGTTVKGLEMQTGQHHGNKTPIHDYFFNASVCLGICCMLVPALMSSAACAYGNQNGLNGRVGAAAAAMQSADIAFNSQNTTADGYGGAAGALPVFQATQQAHAMYQYAKPQDTAVLESSIQQYIIKTVRNINPSVDNWMKSLSAKYHAAFQKAVKEFQTKSLAMKKETKALTAKINAMSKQEASTTPEAWKHALKAEILAEITTQNQATKKYVDNACNILKSSIQGHVANEQERMDEVISLVHDKAREMALKPNRDEVRRDLSTVTRAIEEIKLKLSVHEDTTSAANTPTKK